ncbi:MAG: putative transport system ATP-binding protein [Patescibacteria group bacterium]|nr:putative transport system ATP-binding protein [Patescibacteria group bacterium]
MIKLSDVSKTYNDDFGEPYTALHNITFEIKEGEFVAIMGPSGSGKSTLMNILGALDTPTSGSYFLDNKNVASLTDEELTLIRRHNIGFVFQSFNLLPRTSVLYNVTLPLLYSEVEEEERKKIAKHALESVDLPEQYHRHLSNQLSGGQIQRVAIARALVNNPKIILADEPTGNLDSKTGALVLDTFKRLHKDEGRTIILITHDKTVASHADRLIVIKDGTIVEDSVKKYHAI